MRELFGGTGHSNEAFPLWKTKPNRQIVIKVCTPPILNWKNWKLNVLKTRGFDFRGLNSTSSTHSMKVKKAEINYLINILCKYVMCTEATCIA